MAQQAAPSTDLEIPSDIDWDKVSVYAPTEVDLTAIEPDDTMANDATEARLKKIEADLAVINQNLVVVKDASLKHFGRIQGKTDHLVAKLTQSGTIGTPPPADDKPGQCLPFQKKINAT